VRDDPEDGGLRWPWPVLRSFDGYRSTWVRRDLTAGVLIVAVAIPLSMGMAEVAGMPPVAGLYSCVLPLIAYAIFGSSRQLVIALDASTAALLGASVAALTDGDPLRYAALAGGISVVVGVVLLAAGLLRLGFIADFLSEPVLLGYQAGLAAVVVASQLPKMTGIAADAGTTLGLYADVFGHLGEANLPTVAVAAACIAIYAGLRWWRPGVPGALVALVASTVAVAALGLTDHGVSILGDIPRGFPPIAIPEVSWTDIRAMLGPATAISLLAAADTLVSSRAVAARGGYAVSGNADLVGLGVANVGAGVSGGITVSASAARTAIADSVGSRSQMAGLAAAVLMLLVLSFLTPLLHDVPNATLGAVVTVAVLRLIEIGNLRKLWHVRRTEFVIAAVAFLGVVLIGVLEGVLVATGLSLIDFLRRESKPRDAILGRVPGREGYHDIGRNPTALTDPGVIVYRFDAPLFYANAERFRSRVRRLARRRGATWVVVDAGSIPDVDASATRMLAELDEELRAHGITMVFADPVGSVRDTFARAGLKDLPARIFDTVQEGVDARPEPRADWGDA
jgi:high affinity sulfate transporter 1